MESAFERATGNPQATRFPFAGMTDRAIVRRGLETAGEVPDSARIDEVIAVYVELLAGSVQEAKDYGVYPGVLPALAQAEALAHVAIGLGTGNVRRGAELKLGRVDLFRRFRFGGFGCDHEDRAELLRLGAERGAALLHVERAACRVVVIGDTVRDVDAALAIGAECIAVGTGGEELAVLSRRGARAAFRDLAAVGAMDALLG